MQQQKTKLSWKNRYSENLKIPTPYNSQYYPKLWTVWFHHVIMHTKDADWIANSVAPDQSEGAVSSRSALFAQIFRIITVNIILI